jgi:hypothetical protein
MMLPRSSLGRRESRKKDIERAQVSAAVGKSLPVPALGGALEDAAIAAGGASVRPQSR